MFLQVFPDSADDPVKVRYIITNRKTQVLPTNPQGITTGAEPGSELLDLALVPRLVEVHDSLAIRQATDAGPTTATGSHPVASTLAARELRAARRESSPRVSCSTSRWCVSLLRHASTTMNSATSWSISPWCFRLSR